jgi:hypothetical protein
VKELISAGCNINRASMVKQMTRLAVALAHLQPWFREVQQQDPFFFCFLQFFLRVFSSPN